MTTPWYFSAAIGLLVALLAGALQALIRRAAENRKLRLEYEVSNPVTFKGPSSEERVQHVRVHNRGRVAATNVMVRVARLPLGDAFEYGIASKEPDRSLVADRGELLARQRRLLPGDSIEVHFKFTDGASVLDPQAIDVRCDQGHIRTPTVQQPRSPLRAILEGVAVLLPTMVVAGSMLWVVYRTSEGKEVIPTSSTSKLRRVSALCTERRYEEAASLLSTTPPQFDISLWLSDSAVSPRETLLAVVQFKNAEPVTADELTISLRASGGAVPSQDWAKPYHSLAVGALTPGDVHVESVRFVWRAGGPSAQTVQAAASYAVLGAQRSATSKTRYVTILPDSPSPARRSQKEALGTRPR